MKIDHLIREGYDLLNETTDWPAYDGGTLDRSKYATSSEIWNCSRRIKYGKLFPTEGFPNWGFAERGNVLEQWAIEQVGAALRTHHRSYTLLAAGDRQVSFSHGWQSGTPDGILRLPDYTLEVWEIKSIDPRTNKKKLPKEAHEWQLQQNMDLVAHSMNATVRMGRLIYIDASNLQDRIEFEYPPNEVLMLQMEEKSHIVMEAATPEELPAEGIFRDECRLCDHKARCSALVEQKKKDTALMKQQERAANGLFRQRR